MYTPLADALKKAGRDFIFSLLPYRFTPLEEKVLRLFFTNLHGRVFFFHSLPANVGAALLSMYSRLKNPRGLRGLFVESFLPHLLKTLMEETDNQASTTRTPRLTDFVGGQPANQEVFDLFCQKAGTEPDFLEKLASTKKVLDFLAQWLDAYGHNSIARMGSLWICFEGISILAAKSIEWSRPGSGFVEWSTRFVDAVAQGLYPIEKMLAALKVADQAKVETLMKTSLASYRQMIGTNGNGEFAGFLRERFRPFFPGDNKGLETAVMGEAYDVCGNLLPGATRTSLAVTLSGEALPGLLKHLILDNTPETLALVEAILMEAKKVGADQFCRHYEPTPWDWENWKYLKVVDPGRQNSGNIFSPIPMRVTLPQSGEAQRILLELFRAREDLGAANFEDLTAQLHQVERGEFDKLPSEFEGVSVTVGGVMSFRSWRDFQRHTYMAHWRTRLTPRLGFYRYDKFEVTFLDEIFRTLHRLNREIYTELVDKVPPQILEYLMALGNLVGFQTAINLREAEFVAWQRSKHGVNHEVRQVALSLFRILAQLYPWFGSLCRVDTTPAYYFARTEKAIPLEIE